MSRPAWRSFGETNFIELWQCSPLYQATKPSTHSRAVARSANPSTGKSRRYFVVRNAASEKALSLLTLGRLNELLSPSASSVERSVLDLCGPPLSACSTTALSRHASASTTRVISSAASSPVSVSCTSQPTILRL